MNSNKSYNPDASLTRNLNYNPLGPTHDIWKKQNDLWLLNVRLSECALQSYNKKHKSNYELVQGLRSREFLDGVVWYHANFKAEDKPVSGEESPTKLFFAELKVTKSGYDVKACRILDGDAQISDCHQCKGLLHPTSGFQKGRFVRNMDRVRSLRKRSRDA